MVAKRERITGTEWLEPTDGTQTHSAALFLRISQSQRGPRARKTYRKSATVLKCHTKKCIQARHKSHYISIRVVKLNTWTHKVLDCSCIKGSKDSNCQQVQHPDTVQPQKIKRPGLSDYQSQCPVDHLWINRYGAFQGQTVPECS